MFGLNLKKGNRKNQVVISVESLETRVATLQNGQLEDFKVEHPTEEQIVGSIYKGIIQNLDDNLQAAFVDIGLKKNAFIHYWDMFPEDLARLEVLEGDPTRADLRRHHFSKNEIAKYFRIGSEIIVQVSKASIGTKGPRATANLSIPSHYFVLLPGSKLRGISRKIEDEKERKQLKKMLRRLPVPEGTGLIIRTAGAGVSNSNFIKDMRALLTIWNDAQTNARDNPAPCCIYKEPDLIERVVRDSVSADIDEIIIDSTQEYERVKLILSNISRRTRSHLKLYKGTVPIFQYYQAHHQLENAFQRKVVLKSGGYILFDETEALISVDVNSGQYKSTTSENGAILEVNIQAVEEIARQLRLRNMGGLIVIDLIDMRQRKHRNLVYHTLKEALKKDKARTNVLPISQLGLLEMTRQRVAESSKATMYMDCPYCHGRGSVKSPLNMSIEIQRRLMEIMRKSNGKGALSLRISVNPLVLERLREQDEELLLKIEQKFNGRLRFIADSNQHMEDISIVKEDTGDVLFTTSRINK